MTWQIVTPQREEARGYTVIPRLLAFQDSVKLNRCRVTSSKTMNMSKTDGRAKMGRVFSMGIKTVTVLHYMIGPARRFLLENFKP
jgi:hypothetical protein